MSSYDQNLCRESQQRKRKNDQNGTNLLTKSPSDTTLYSPALHRMNVDDISLIDKISNFVESIRLDERNRVRSRSSKSKSHGKGTVENSPVAATPSGDTRRVEHASTSRCGCNRSRSPRENLKGGCRSRSSSLLPQPHTSEVTDQLLVQAEKFKAHIQAPRGNHSDFLMPYDYEKLRSKFVRPDGLAPIDSEILFLRNFDQDDEFFHVTSQIDPSLRIKIERGDFIDLERLLP